LSRAGATVVELATPAEFDQLTVHRAVVNAYERARGLAGEWFAGREGFSSQMIRTCDAGFSVTRSQYVQALLVIERFRLQMDDYFADVDADVDAVLTPAASGEAPAGIAYAGDPRFQELWTLLHMPAVSLPAHRGPTGLPVGIQLVAPRYGDDKLLTVARWVEARLQ
jgi:Asp-tRNA(Asn)/Glu-tRNA(Gln) amidotransferase A subunit family amidase